MVVVEPFHWRGDSVVGNADAELLASSSFGAIASRTHDAATVSTQRSERHATSQLGSRRCCPTPSRTRRSSGPAPLAAHSWHTVLRTRVEAAIAASQGRSQGRGEGVLAGSGPQRSRTAVRVAEEHDSGPTAPCAAMAARTSGSSRSRSVFRRVSIPSPPPPPGVWGPTTFGPVAGPTDNGSPGSRRARSRGCGRRLWETTSGRRAPRYHPLAQRSQAAAAAIPYAPVLPARRPEGRSPRSQCSR